ncbi:tripartite tricarboxylate transporter substrate binding protein [Bordetella bronchiseptica]
MNRRHALKVLGAAALPALGWPMSAMAGEFPQKPIRFISPSPPGGVTNFLPRLLGQEMSKILGQPVVIENRTGGNQTIATNYVAKAAPDGYTILLATSGALAVNPHLIADIPYQPLTDFEPISMLGGVASVVMATHASDARTLAQLLEAGRGKGRKPAFGHTGIGTSPHLVLEALKQEAGIDIVDVPYKGTQQLFTDAKGGQFEFLCNNIGPSLPLIRNGDLRALAVTSRKRSPALPDVPAIAETLPGFEVLGWMAAYAPAGTPADVIDRLAAALHASLATDEVRKALANFAIDAMPTSPQEAKDFLAAEYRRWGEVVRRSGIRI